MIVMQDQEQWAQAVNNLIFHTLTQEAIMNKKATADDTEFLEYLILCFLINTVMITETVYINILKSMTQLLLWLQQKNVFARQQCEKLISLSIESKTNSCSLWKKFKDNLLRYKSKIYMSNNSAIITEIMCINYDDLQSDHFGPKHTLKSVHHKYYWHSMTWDVKGYIYSCDMCQRVAVHCYKQYNQLELLFQSSLFMNIIIMNFITDLLLSK